MFWDYNLVIRRNTSMKSRDIKKYSKLYSLILKTSQQLHKHNCVKMLWHKNAISAYYFLKTSCLVILLQNCQCSKFFEKSSFNILYASLVHMPNEITIHAVTEQQIFYSLNFLWQYWTVFIFNCYFFFFLLSLLPLKPIIQAYLT